jgi:peptidoglycan-N-acetylglucosamine deacetylase
MSRKRVTRTIAWIASFLLIYGTLVYLFSLLPWPYGLPLAIATAVAATAAAVYWIDMMLPGVNLLSEATCRIPEADAVALTFDDGPVEPYTRQILDILDRNGAKGTFFCLGDNVEANPDLAREIVRRGHAIGNHTYSHRILPLLSAEECRAELERGATAIERTTGLRPTLVRCPKGYKSRKVTSIVAETGGKLFGFSYPIFDVENPPAGELVDRVLRKVRAGDIIVMHDGFSQRCPGKRDSLVEALDPILKGLKEKRLRAVSLDRP